MIADHMYLCKTAFLWCFPLYVNYFDEDEEIQALVCLTLEVVVVMLYPKMDILWVRLQFAKGDPTMPLVDCVSLHNVVFLV